MDGGDGNDVLLSRSDAGEMVAAQDGTTQIFADETAAFYCGKRYPHRWSWRPTPSRFEGLVNAKDEIVCQNTSMPTAPSTGMGVTGENNAVHDHWVDGFGNDVIRDFQPQAGRQDRNLGRTPPRVKSIEHLDSNGRRQGPITA